MREALMFVVYAIGVTSAIFVPDWNDLMGSFVNFSLVVNVELVPMHHFICVLYDDIEDSSEHLGAAVAQVNQHPYAASLLLNNSYICSAVVLNNYWVLTLSKCFNQNQSTSLPSYITHNNLSNFSIRVGSSYNSKGGFVHKIKMVSNHFDLHVSAIKVETPMKFSSQVQAVNLPNSNDEVSLGFLASAIAWTPSNHMRTVNMPLIDPGVCDRITKMMPGNYVCLAGVQDPNRHFCRRDNGGAVIQNNTLIAISSFINTCAQYSKKHAFPKTAPFTNWLDSIIWDADNRPTTTELTTTSNATTVKVQKKTNASEANVTTSTIHYDEPNIYMLTLPFDPINVPLEPSEDNSVLPGMSLYESYIQSMLKARQVSTVKPTVQETKSTPVPNVEQPKHNNIHRKSPIRYNFNYN